MEVMSSCASKCSLHRLKNIDENTPALSEAISRAIAPETPTESMEFLARSWSVSAVELSKALSNSHSNTVSLINPPSHDDNGGGGGGDDTISMNILKESNLQQVPKETSPPISPRGSDEMRELFLLHQALNPDFLSHQQQQLHKNGVYKSMVRKKTMRRWVRDQREQKKHEIRTQNAQVHAAVSVAGVAAAVASLAASAATFPEASARGKAAPAMASAAGVVASHCIEIAEEMGAGHDQILAVVNSAVNARTNGDIMALTAAAATALRGASILKTRMQKGYGTTTATTAIGVSDDKDKLDQSNESNHILSSLNFVSRGGDLLKRTRKGDLHWKQVSFSINSNWQVVAKMKSTYMGGTFTKKKKCVVSGVCCDVAAWPGRAVKDGSGERRTYFGIKTGDRVIEFECRNKDEKLMWTHGIQHMLNCHPNVPVF